MEQQSTSASLLQNCMLYAGLAWKHHIAEHFEDGLCPTHPNGAGAGGTVFIDYKKMIEYLKADGRRWYVAELQLDNDPLLFEFGNDWMATILVDKSSYAGFKPCI